MSEIKEYNETKVKYIDKYGNTSFMLLKDVEKKNPDFFNKIKETYPNPYEQKEIAAKEFDPDYTLKKIKDMEEKVEFMRKVSLGEYDERIRQRMEDLKRGNLTGGGVVPLNNENQKRGNEKMTDYKGEPQEVIRKLYADAKDKSDPVKAYEAERKIQRLWRLMGEDLKFGANVHSQINREFNKYKTCMKCLNLCDKEAEVCPRCGHMFNKIMVSGIPMTVEGSKSASEFPDDDTR